MRVPAPLIHDALSINGIKMNCLEYPSDAPPMLLLHSLSGNAHLFDGLVAAGLAGSFRLLVPDQRGRGYTESPMSGYSLEDGCQDLIALLDHFGLDKVAVCGHSFGGLLALYFASQYPERVTRLVMLDAAAQMHPATPMMTAMAAARLDSIYLSAESYLAFVKMAPFVDRWYDEMEGFVMADIQPVGLGMQTTRSHSYTATLSSLHIYSNSVRDWRAMASTVHQPALVVRAESPFFMGMPMLTEDGARETVALMHDARYASVEGNHFSMLFGPGAEQTVLAIIDLFTDPAMQHETAEAEA